MGSFTVKVLPFASSLCSSMVPPCLYTSILLRARPKPLPLALVVKSCPRPLPIWYAHPQGRPRIRPTAR